MVSVYELVWGRTCRVPIGKHETRDKSSTWAIFVACMPTIFFLSNTGNGPYSLGLNFFNGRLALMFFAFNIT